MNRALPFLLILLSSLLNGCGLSFFGAKVETAKTVASAPSDVTVHVTVQDGGDPVGYLSSNNFQVYENDVLLEEGEISLRLLSRESVAAGFTILLLDLSRSPTEMELTRISRGAAHFVEIVSTTQPVTVVAFDGSDRAREVARFAKVEASTKRPLPPLAPFMSTDNSRDLNSALLAAIKGLATSLKGQKGEVHYGTIATLVRGPDLAARKSDKEIQSAIRDSGYEFFSLSPEEIKIKTLSDIGKNERFTYSTIDTLPMRFQDLGMRVRAAWQSHYLVAYCSPARAGIRKLKVKVTYENEAGAKRSGSSKSEFDATGFQAGCVPRGATQELAPEAESAATPNDEPPVEEEEAPPPKKWGRKNKKLDSGGSKPSSPPDEGGEGDDDDVVAPPSKSGKYE